MHQYYDRVRIVKNNVIDKMTEVNIKKEAATLRKLDQQQKYHSLKL
jgi:hypothetical protein